MAEKKKAGKSEKEDLEEGKESTKNSKDSEKRESKKEKRKQVEEENRILRNIFIGIGIFVLIILLVLGFLKMVRTVNYENIEFDLVREGELIFYHTTFPVIHNGKLTEYNIYLRNNPKKLAKKVPIESPLENIEDLTVLNLASNFSCDGDEVISIANLVNVHKAIGKDLVRDNESGCDLFGRYAYLNIRESNETSIERFGPKCYNVNVNNCEILEGTERYILEMLTKINEEK